MKSPRKAYNDGLARGREESAETIRKLKAALDKALAENLNQRLPHLDAVARQGSHAAIAR